MIKLILGNSHQSFTRSRSNMTASGTVASFLMIDTVELCGIVDDDDYSQPTGATKLPGRSRCLGLDRGTTAKFVKVSGN